VELLQRTSPFKIQLNNYSDWLYTSCRAERVLEIRWKRSYHDITSCHYLLHRLCNFFILVLLLFDCSLELCQCGKSCNEIDYL